ncbi:MAG: T9SS type A sorting domain-containing protein [FCB group bacterium]|nr:T9SS type A sorting domain-containing protein [FCB group bacterium]
MKQKQFIFIIVIMLLSIGLFAANDMGKGGSYDGAAMLTSGIISMGDIPLPVNLSAFYALYIGGTPTLYWTTQSETDNAYWNVYRGTSNNFETTVNINANAPVPGNGTTTNASDYIYVDTLPVVQNATYWYWIEDVSTDGETEVHEPITLSVPFEDVPITPDTYGLHQNYPNPFNPSTSISFALAEDSNVELIIYNIKGRKIRSIFNEYIYADQVNTAVWNGKDTDGKEVASGVYFYRLITETKEYQKKMLLVK